jgi:glutathione S-transferase
MSRQRTVDFVVRRPIRLHGYPVSNYFNIVRAALLEKGIPHEIVIARAEQTDSFFAKNPMGKIPMLECADGWIAETVAILEYLEDIAAGTSLRAETPGGRARARQLTNIVQLYVEMPARTLFPGVFGGATNSPAAKAAARAMLDRSTLALRRMARPDPFLGGRQLSSVDLFAFYNLDIVDRLSRFVWDRSIVDEARLAEWHCEIMARASSQTVLADFETYFADYLQKNGAPYRAPNDQPGHIEHA